MDYEQQKRIVNECQIRQLLTYCLKHLHRIFGERWEYYCQLNNGIAPWNNDETSGKELVQLFAYIPKEMKDSLHSGKIDSWDITLTNKAIQAISTEIRKYGGNLDETENTVINKLRIIRNDVSHLPKSEISDDEFIKFQNRIETILLVFGEDQAEIDKLKENLNELSQPKNMPDSNSEFIMLKGNANKFFGEKNFNEAIEKYNEILQLPNLSPENQALIYSNRCAAYLKFSDDKSIQMAKRDAEYANKLWPCWWKGYYRLGCVHGKLKEFREAAKNLETALALNPKSKEVLDELSAVRREYGIISREEHFRPAQQPVSYDSAKEEASKTLGISKDECDRLLNISLNTPLGDVLRGHYHRDGEGVPQDYTKAATYYAKAARNGIPEGMYNLAQLYESGKGVHQDFKKSLRWLLKAANDESSSHIGSGIPEAQHSLGVKYEAGIGVKRNYKIAADWYEKAASNNFPPSANNLGLLYKHGFGVERCLKKAYEYFKIAAQGGDTPSMINLAFCYFAAEGTNSVVPKEADIAEGMKWLQLATDKGDMVAEKELERRKHFTANESKVESIKDFFMSTTGLGPEANPLDEKQFRGEVEKAVKNGSVVARRQLDIWDNLNFAMNSFRMNNPSRLFAALSKAIRLDHQIVLVPEIFYGIIQDGMKNNPNDMDIITCYIRMNSKDSFLREYIREIQEKSAGIFDEYLTEMTIAKSIVMKDYECAIKMAEEALKVHPDSLRILYVRALALSLCSSDECIKALDDFLAVAPNDHDKVPACHYRKASYYSLKNEDIQFKASMEAGIAAEKDQLPCFLPYQFPMKDFLLKIYDCGSLQQIFNEMKILI